MDLCGSRVGVVVRAIGTFRSEYDYEYEFSILSMRIRF